MTTTIPERHFTFRNNIAKKLFVKHMMESLGTQYHSENLFESDHPISGQEFIKISNNMYVHAWSANREKINSEPYPSGSTFYTRVPQLVDTCIFILSHVNSK